MSPSVSLVQFPGGRLGNQLFLTEISMGSVVSFMWWGKIESTCGTSATLFGQLYQPRMTDDEFGAVGGMRIGRRNLPQCHFIHHISHMT
jgi:hypothetical protein